MDVIFLPFSLEPGLTESRPDQPLGALARQVPHLLCGLTHGQDGVHTRFFPFLGSQTGKRDFVVLEDLLPPDQVLGQLLGSVQPTPECIVDGHIGAREVTIRALRAGEEGPEISGIVSFPCDLEDPRVLLNRLTLELWDLLDLCTRPRVPTSLGRDTLWLHIEAMDCELALRAGLMGRDEDPMAACMQALALEPQAHELHEALLSIAKVCIEQRGQDTMLAAAALAHAATEAEVGRAWLDRAFLLAQQSGHQEATLELGRAILQRDPVQLDMALGLARYLAGQKRYSEARRLLMHSFDAARQEEATQESGQVEGTEAEEERRGEILALLFQLSSTLGDDDAGDQWMAALLEARHQPVLVRPFIVQWLTDHGRMDEARTWLDRALAEDEPDPALALALGRLLLFEGKREEATRWLDAASEGEKHVRMEAERLRRQAGGEPVLARLQEIEEMHRAGRDADALPLARKLTKLRPDLVECWYALGLVRSGLGQPLRAIRALRKALACKGDHQPTRNRLGILLVSTGRYQDAYRELEQVLEQDQDLMSPLLHMTQACYHLKRHEEAVQYLERAEGLFPDHPAVRKTRTIFYPAH